MSWYILIQGEQRGPFQAEQIRTYVKRGEAGPQDLVWKEGLAEWTPISNIPEFHAGGSPPHPPPGPPHTPAYTTTTPAAHQSAGTPGVAIASFILGLLSLIGGIFTAVPAIICGHIALGRFRNLPGLQGRWMAMTGVIMGYVIMSFGLLGLIVAIALPAFVGARDAARENVCINNLRQIKGATQMYAVEYNKAARDTVTEGDWETILGYLDDPNLMCPLGSEAYPKPETFDSDPICPNASIRPDHALP